MVLFGCTRIVVSTSIHNPYALEWVEVKLRACLMLSDVPRSTYVKVHWNIIEFKFHYNLLQHI